MRIFRGTGEVMSFEQFYDAYIHRFGNLGTRVEFAGLTTAYNQCDAIFYPPGCRSAGGYSFPPPVLNPKEDEKDPMFHGTDHKLVCGEITCGNTSVKIGTLNVNAPAALPHYRRDWDIVDYAVAAYPLLAKKEVTWVADEKDQFKQWKGQAAEFEEQYAEFAAESEKPANAQTTLSFSDALETTRGILEETLRGSYKTPGQFFAFVKSKIKNEAQLENAKLSGLQWDGRLEQVFDELCGKLKETSDIEGLDVLCLQEAGHENNKHVLQKHFPGWRIHFASPPMRWPSKPHLYTKSDAGVHYVPAMVQDSMVIMFRPQTFENIAVEDLQFAYRPMNQERVYQYADFEVQGVQFHLNHYHMPGGRPLDVQVVREYYGKTLEAFQTFLQHNLVPEIRQGAINVGDFNTPMTAAGSTREGLVDLWNAQTRPAPLPAPTALPPPATPPGARAQTRSWLPWRLKPGARQ